MDFERLCIEAPEFLVECDELLLEVSVVNGFTGSVVGTAPIDRVKVAIAIMLLVVIALLIARCERREPEPEPEPDQTAQSGSSASQGTTASTNRPG